MRFVVIAVGRLKSGPERDLVSAYAKRMRTRLDVVEIDDRKTASAPDGKRREAEAIRAAIPDGAITIALDETGKAMPTVAFADALERWRDAGTGTVVFVIGGADGLDPDLRSACQAAIAFGPMTWPHRLVRVMIVEQLYRVESLWAGHPYHRA